MNYLDVLGKAQLFKGIVQSEIPQILACLSATQREYDKDAILIWEDEPTDEVGILLSGSARSIKTGISGKSVIVSLLAPGNYIGVLLAASHDRKSPVSVRAFEPCQALFIPIENILRRDHCPRHYELLRNLVDGIAEKALVLHDRNDCLIKSSIREKVLTYLAQKSKEAHSNSFTIPFNRVAMAEYLDVDRSALSRELAWMQRDGLIRYCKNSFELLLNYGAET